jgi:hypothetical protein
MVNTILIIAGIVIAILIIPLIWNKNYFRYIKKVKADYNKDVLDFEKITKDSTVTERLLKLYWSRQQTYEFSGYAILLIAIILLLGCIAIFIFSDCIVTNIMIVTDKNTYWISLLSLRIGISLIVFFICQILLKLYRYCVKFAVFYIGLFDSLLIYKEIGVELKDAIAMFMPGTDIGDSPNSPANEIIQLLANFQKAKTAVS